MQRYFTLQIFECFDKTRGHSKKCNVISFCKYVSALIYLLEALKKMQRYVTLQIFECFDIPIDDLWVEIDVLDGMRMRRRMHSFFCRHSILRITPNNI